MEGFRIDLKTFLGLVMPYHTNVNIKMVSELYFWAIAFKVPICDPKLKNQTKLHTM